MVIVETPRSNSRNSKSAEQSCRIEGDKRVSLDSRAPKCREIPDYGLSSSKLSRSEASAASRRLLELRHAYEASATDAKVTSLPFTKLLPEDSVGFKPPVRWLNENQ